MENHWILGSAVVLVVENGGAGWSKLVTPVGVYLPCDSGVSRLGQFPRPSVRPPPSPLGVLEAVALARRLQNVAAVRCKEVSHRGFLGSVSSHQEGTCDAPPR